MRISLCTITFRHHLLSLEDIALWARANDFQGIELWGAHGRNMAREPHRDGSWVAGFGLTVPMVSDYLPVEADLPVLYGKTHDLCRLARHWHAGKVRTFAGKQSSAATPPDERRQITARLREMCTIAAGNGLRLVVETHPGTLADSGSSTLRLVEEVDHPAFRLNFDVLHVWEGGDDPVALHDRLRPHIAHYHLKNVRSRADLSVFEPSNVYAAAGRRDGMMPLFEGRLDYVRFLEELRHDPSAEASLEWFGHDCFDTLRNDRLGIARLMSDNRAGLKSAMV